MSPLNDPRTLFPTVDPPEQTQPEPGLDRNLQPPADLGMDSYVGHDRLTGRKALITGGDSGIGAAAAIAYAREGADVAIAYLPEEQPDADVILKAIGDAGRRGIGIPVDLSTLEGCRKVVADTVEALGGLDILVNNASRQIWHDGIENLPDEDFDLTMRTNVYSAYRVTKEALPHLKPGSSIIFTSSVQAYDPSETLIDYGITKAAMNHLSKSLAMELTPKGIRVNAVAPGPFWTPLQPSHGQPMEKVTSFGQSSALGRAGHPAELAGAYVYLASDEASYTSGSTLSVTGGRPTP